MPRLWILLNDGTIEAQEPDGREILAAMRRAVTSHGKVEWHETCHCSPPLRHESATVYDQFFSDMEIGPSIAATHPKGESFWRYLEDRHAEKDKGHRDDSVSVTRFVPLRIF